MNEVVEMVDSEASWLPVPSPAFLPSTSVLVHLCQSCILPLRTLDL